MVEKKQFEDYKLNVNPLSSKEKGEIISASKVSIFSQCPLKYLLTYDYGFKELNAGYRNYKIKNESGKYSILSEVEDDIIDDRFELVEEREF